MSEIQELCFKQSKYGKYFKNDPPDKANTNWVWLDIEARPVVDVNEESQIVTFIARVRLEWIDPRLTIKNSDYWDLFSSRYILL